MTGFTTDRAHLADDKPLTPMQYAVGLCVLLAMTNTEIGQAIGKTRAAVERHLESLMRRYGARTRVDLALQLQGVARAPEVAA